MAATKAQVESYIRQAATARCIDPNVAVRVARSEGLNGNPAEGWQSRVVKNGVREPSYGPFQLFMGGGLGNVFQNSTGLDPRDPDTVYAQIDFALSHAAQNGGGAGYGARKVGIANRQGIGKGPHGPFAPMGAGQRATIASGQPSWVPPGSRYTPAAEPGSP